MKRFVVGAIAALISFGAYAVTLTPLSLLSTTGSTAGQAIVSTGPTTAPTFGVVGVNGGGTGASTTAGALTSLGAQPLANIPCPSILDHGGNKGGSVDNTTAFANTIAASPSGQACVFFPPGTYAFSSQAVYTLPSSTAEITILGSGAENTKLLWTAGQGLKINYVSQYNSAHIRDLTILTSTTNTGNGIFLNQTATSVGNPAASALSDISNVTIRGSDGYSITDYWATAVNVTGVSNVNFYGDMVFGSTTSQGLGVQLSASVAVPAVVFNFSGCTFDYLNIGINYGTYIQGVTVGQSNFTGGNIGINVPAGESGLDELLVTASQFEVFTTAINESTAVPGTNITGNFFIVPSNKVGIQFSAANLFSVTGNTFTPAGSVSNTGIVVAGSVLPGVIVGNNFYGMGGAAVWLQGTSSSVNLQANTYSTNGTNVLNSGANNILGDNMLPNLIGTTGSIGGSALAAGACSSGTVSVASATTSMAVSASPVTYPGDGNFWEGYVSAAGTVTVKVCAAVAGTPTASTYNVRVLQ